MGVCGDEGDGMGEVEGLRICRRVGSYVWDTREKKVVVTWCNGRTISYDY